MRIEPATVHDTQAIVSIFIANKGDPGLFQESDAEVRRNLQDFLVGGTQMEKPSPAPVFIETRLNWPKSMVLRSYQTFKVRELAQCSYRNVRNEPPQAR